MILIGTFLTILPLLESVKAQACLCNQQSDGLNTFSLILIVVLGLLLAAVLGLTIMVIKLSFLRATPIRRRPTIELQSTETKRTSGTRQNIDDGSPESREPILSAIYAEATDTPEHKPGNVGNGVQPKPEPAAEQHYASTEPFEITEETPPKNISRGGKYGYSKVIKTPKLKHKELEQTPEVTPKETPTDGAVYMPLADNEYDHLHKSRPKNQKALGQKVLPYSSVSIKGKRVLPVDPQETYDVPPPTNNGGADDQETYDVPKSTDDTYSIPNSNEPIEGSTYDSPKNNKKVHDPQETYDVPPSTYDVPPPSATRQRPGNTVYDHPPLIPTPFQDVYDVPKSSTLQK